VSDVSRRIGRGLDDRNFRLDSERLDRIDGRRRQRSIHVDERHDGFGLVRERRQLEHWFSGWRIDRFDRGRIDCRHGGWIDGGHHGRIDLRRGRRIDQRVGQLA